MTTIQRLRIVLPLFCIVLLAFLTAANIKPFPTPVAMGALVMVAASVLGAVTLSNIAQPLLSALRTADAPQADESRAQRAERMRRCLERLPRTAQTLTHWLFAGYFQAFYLLTCAVALFQSDSNAWHILVAVIGLVTAAIVSVLAFTINIILMHKPQQI